LKKVYDDQKNILTYLDHLFLFIKNDPNAQKEILRKLNTPIGPNNIEKLLMSMSEILETYFENLSGYQYEPILDIKLYIKLEEQLRDTQYKSEKLTGIQMERKHILHKLIFDSLNEKLDHKRIYGLKGLPMAYSNHQLRLPNMKGKLILSKDDELN
jgi:hypothetical protein